MNKDIKKSQISSEDIKNDIRMFLPSSMQEEQDKLGMLSYLEEYQDDIFRENERGHITVSSFIINKEHTKTLFAYHKIFDSFAWIGGHLEKEDESLFMAAKRELIEETGLRHFSSLLASIFSLETLGCQGHMKKGTWVSSHIHFNVTFLFEADESEELTVKEDENTGFKWILFDDVKNVSNENWIIENVYMKLISKIRQMDEKS